MSRKRANTVGTLSPEKHSLWKTPVPLGRRGPLVTRMGLGGAPLGGLFRGVREVDALATLRTAMDAGFNLFDTAPFYGSGRSEQRFGTVLGPQPRDSFVLSTKVGRALEPVLTQTPPNSDYKDTLPFAPVFDFSRTGVLRSFEESLTRLQLERIDLLLIHDPDEYWEQAIGEAYPTLEALRGQGVIRGIGVGMNQTEMLLRFAQEGDFDCFLLAGRYTLLDQSALDALLPLCLRKGISIMAGGVFNSGILASGAVPGATYDYVPANPEVLERTRRLEQVCQRHGVSLKAAALQFPLAHPAVATVLIGARSPLELRENVWLMEQTLPAALWAEMKSEGLIHPLAPVPA
ncbi:MAG: aldo/keto reductase [Deltaproteobacteria bacterium]|nr:aldo/keto reductase [Deltaproteobacteria bacterium]